MLSSNDTMTNLNIFSLSKHDRDVYKDVKHSQHPLTSRKMNNNNLRRKIMSKHKRSSHLNDKNVKLDCGLSVDRREKDNINSVSHRKPAIVPSRTVAL